MEMFKERSTRETIFPMHRILEDLKEDKRMVFFCDVNNVHKPLYGSARRDFSYRDGKMVFEPQGDDFHEIGSPTKFFVTIVERYKSLYGSDDLEIREERVWSRGTFLFSGKDSYVNVYILFGKTDEAADRAKKIFDELNELFLEEEAIVRFEKAIKILNSMGKTVKIERPHFNCLKDTVVSGENIKELWEIYKQIK